METLTNWWRSLTGTAAPAEQQPVVENPSGVATVEGGRKRKSKKTRRGGKKSRKSKPSRK